jgi:Predicted metal-dependent hydrolases related to alanyl-tRNA synthetase HxxxH domain
MSTRLYYEDSYLTSFRSPVLSSRDGGRKLVLSQTAFYPTSGGQPFDLGTLNGIPVVDVLEEDGEIVHVVESPIEAGEVEGRIDWNRRFDHMQQHSGQHLLSAILAERFGIQTVSFHLGAAASTIDVEARELPDAVEELANFALAQNRRVDVTFEEKASDLRKASGREGTLRIVSIEGLDRSACGGPMSAPPGKSA